MRAQILKELDKTWLILEGEEPVPTENYQTRMLMGNMIPSILKVRTGEADFALISRRGSPLRRYVRMK